MARILILWLLSESPLHGYRIQQALRSDAMKLWFELRDASIYSMLRSLLKQGWAAIEGDEREGNRPARRVYRITKNGRAELQRALAGSLAGPASRKRSLLRRPGHPGRVRSRRGSLLSGGPAKRPPGAARSARPARSRRPLSRLLLSREEALVTAELAWIEGVLSAPEPSAH